jgi:hypothetical protein
VAGAVAWPGREGTLYVPETALLAPELMAAAGIPATPSYQSAQSPRFATYALPAAEPEPAVSAPVSFEQQITLLGYTARPADNGGPQLLTFWRVLAPLPEDLAIFVHVVDGEGTIIAQHDGLDAAPAHLRPGDVVVQRHPLPAGLAADAAVQLGLYRRSSGRRLTHEGAPADIFRLPGNPFEAAGQAAP